MKKGVFSLVLVLLILLPMAFGADDIHYLVTDSKNQRVLELDNQSRYVWEYKCAGNGCYCERGNCFFGFDSGTRLDNGNTLLIDNVYNKVLEVDVEGNTVWRLGDGTAGSFFNQVNHPTTAFRMPNGNTLVADTGNNRVIEVEKGKAVTWEYGCSNKFVGCDAITTGEFLTSPAAATWTADGTILITDTGNNRIIEVGKNNEILWTYGCVMDGVNKDCPTGDAAILSPRFAVRLANSTLITDSGNNRVIEVDMSGRIIWKYGSTVGNGENELNLPKSAVPLKNGNVLITDAGNNRIIAVEKQTKKIIYEYRGLNTPSYAEVPKINYDRVRTKNAGCHQETDGFVFELESSVQPKYTYVVRNGEERKQYLLGRYADEKFVSNPEKITKSGQYTLYATYDERVVNYTVYCKLDNLICNAINLSINSCYLEGGVLNVSFSGLGEQGKFINFQNMFLDIKAQERIWEDISKRSCGQTPSLGLQRYGVGSYVKKTGDDEYNFVAPLGMYNVRLVDMMLAECCEEDLSGKMVYPRSRDFESCTVVKRCKGDIECDDGSRYTEDFCSAGICHNERKNATCFDDNDCNDYSKCTRDVCVTGRCSYTSTCGECSYCGSRDGCVMNESCVLAKEKEDNANGLLKDKPSDVVETKTKNGSLWTYILSGVLGALLIAGLSGGAVYYIITKKKAADQPIIVKKEEKKSESTVERELTQKQQVKAAEIAQAFSGAEAQAPTQVLPEQPASQEKGHTRVMLNEVVKTEPAVSEAKVAEAPKIVPENPEKGHTRVMLDEVIKAPVQASPAAQAEQPKVYADFGKKVGEESSLGMVDGRRVRSLEDLLDALKNSTTDILAAHIKDGKNDFAEWVAKGLGDAALGEKIAAMKTKGELVAFLEAIRPKTA